MATCIGCDEELVIGGRLRLGMRVVCGNCGARLEVVSLDPLEVDWADEGDDDEDDGWDDGGDLDDDLDDSPYDEFDDEDLDDEDLDDEDLDDDEPDGW
jgi:lysine biosynthesis protein LysW